MSPGLIGRCTQILFIKQARNSYKCTVMSPGLTGRCTQILFIKQARSSYKCTVMSPGLTGSSETCQRLITGILEGLLFENVLTYIDEMLIFSKSYSEHLQDRVNRLWDANLQDIESTAYGMPI